jgi:hypothetical protein
MGRGFSNLSWDPVGWWRETAGERVLENGMGAASTGTRVRIRRGTRADVSGVSRVGGYVDSSTDADAFVKRRPVPELRQFGGVYLFWHDRLQAAHAGDAGSDAPVAGGDERSSVLQEAPSHREMESSRAAR